jgi:hypothetical protein
LSPNAAPASLAAAAAAAAAVEGGKGGAGNTSLEAAPEADLSKWAGVKARGWEEEEEEEDSPLNDLFLFLAI